MILTLTREYASKCAFDCFFKNNLFFMRLINMMMVAVNVLLLLPLLLLLQLRFLWWLGDGPLHGLGSPSFGPAALTVLVIYILPVYL